MRNGKLPAEASSASAGIDAYEEALALSLDVRYAVAFGFARHALVAILDAAGAQPGRHVVLSPLTCKVVPLALLSLGLVPAYADISPHTLNLDPNRVDEAAGANACAIVFQHTYGNLAGATDVAAVAARRGVIMVEDCAQCLPYADATYRPGSYGVAAVFSNNLMKPMPAGAGGAAATRDPALAQAVRARRDRLPRPDRRADARLRAERWAHEHLLHPVLYWTAFDVYRTLSAGYRVRPVEREIADEITRGARGISEYQAREGMAALRAVAAHAGHRRRSCIEYAGALGEAADRAPRAIEPAQPLYYFPVLARDKAALLAQARKRRLEVVSWPIASPIYPVLRTDDLRAYGYEPGSCPVAEAVAQRLVGLPLRGAISAEHRRRVIALVAGPGGQGR